MVVRATAAATEEEVNRVLRSAQLDGSTLWRFGAESLAGLCAFLRGEGGGGASL